MKRNQAEDRTDETPPGTDENPENKGLAVDSAQGTEKFTERLVDSLVDAVADGDMPALDVVALTGQTEDRDKKDDGGPRSLPLLPLRSDVPFPQIIMPLVVGRDKGIALIDKVLKGDKLVGLVTQKSPDIEEPTATDLYPTLCIAAVLKMLKFPDGSTRIVAQGLRRARLLTVTEQEPFLVGTVEPFEDIPAEGVEAAALVHSVRGLFQKLLDSGVPIPEEMQIAALNAPNPGALADLLMSGLNFTTEEKHELLAQADVSLRLKGLLALLRYQVEMHDLSSRIQGEVSQELSRAQRDMFLRQQLLAIKRELGDVDEDLSESAEFAERLDTLHLPEAAHKEARRELDRMAQMHPSTPEYHVIRTFLDTLLSMPWHESTKDRLDIRRAKKVLDADHYDLEKVKDRILEFLAVRKLKSDMRGPILCFVGPPGVGKTSLGRSVARAMGRKFTRVSLGGVHDEAEIRGHRRTYIGAMPGRIVQGLRKLGINNPVFMLDEIDKLGKDYRGDPASAMLEVLDPEQNWSFRDHYLDVEFDLSKVFFICTANQLTTIPSALLDRMEVIELSGYSEEEKLAIARRYLVPKQMREHGLEPELASFTDAALREVIGSYTHEAGLRNLEREIAALCRKIARSFAEGKRQKVKVDPKKATLLLGPPKYIREFRENLVPGVANGLAWTPVGGEVLTIETVAAPNGKEGLKLTGSLGEVMKESAHAALGYLRSHPARLQIPPTFFEDQSVHIHIPAGAIAKDGPSAGIALFASILSLARGQTLRPQLAMTGEITLTGRVLPVGGIREKMLAARREGLETIILPALNEKDVAELPPEVKNDLTFVFVRHMDEVIDYLFSDEPAAQPRRTKAKVIRRKRPTSPQVQPTPPGD